MASWDGRLFLKSAHWASESCLSETRFLGGKGRSRGQKNQETCQRRLAKEANALATSQQRLRTTALQHRCPSLAGFLVMGLINDCS
jgi:hypothetical protein